MSWVYGFLCLVSINSRSYYAVQTRGKAVTLWPEVLGNQFSSGHLSLRLPHKHTECVTRVTLCPVAVLRSQGSMVVGVFSGQDVIWTKQGRMASAG